MRYERTLSFLCLFVPLCGQSFAGTPRLARVTPPGAQRGTTVEVDFTGRFLNQPREVAIVREDNAVF